MIYAGELLQMREIRSGSGYLSQNELKLLFGLGNRTVVDKIEIRWPNGDVQKLKQMYVNQLIIVREE